MEHPQGVGIVGTELLGLVYAYLSYIRKKKYCPTPTTTTPAAALYVTLRVGWRALVKD